MRSASLRYCTQTDVTHLVEEFGLRLVLDLRTQREIDKDGPTALAEAGVETVALTFIPEEGRTLPETEEDVDPLTQSYLGYLRDRGLRADGGDAAEYDADAQQCGSGGSRKKRSDLSIGLHDREASFPGYSSRRGRLQMCYSYMRNIT